MRLALICLAVVLFMSGCSQPEPPLAGGKPVQHWVDAAKDPDPKVRKTALFKLGNVGPKDPVVLPALVAALQDAEAEVRCQAIVALVKCVPESRKYLPELAELEEQDSDAKVRDYAARAQRKLSETPARQ